ncbi:MAG: hypothetical protein H7X94_03315 [Vallitaleaceae bacterium]|nr:hypothetical protein [Vallitaleaceae bacterium]
MTNKLEISENLFTHLCAACFNQIMTSWMAIHLKEFESKTFAFKDVKGDKYTIELERLGCSMGLDFEIRLAVNDGTEHNVSIMGKIDCQQEEIWNQLVLKIKSAVHTRYLEMADRPFGESQDQLIGDEVAGQIQYDGNRYDDIPILVIDGKKYTWKEFGRMLSPSGGQSFKLKIYDTVEEIA